MKLYIKIILPVIALLAGHLHAMDLPPQGVVIENSYGGRIKVLWKTHDGKSHYEIINPAASRRIARLHDLERDSALSFQAYGKLKGLYSRIKDKIAWSASVTVEDLQSKWKEIYGGGKKDLNVRVIPWYWGASVDFEYSLKDRERDVLGLDPIILENFPAFENYPEIKKAITDVNQIFEYKTLSTPVKLEGKQVATAEDVYRYILGLDTNYTEDDVKKAYFAQFEKFSPIFRAEKERQALAENETLKIILPLLQASRARLLKEPVGK